MTTYNVLAGVCELVNANSPNEARLILDKRLRAAGFQAYDLEGASLDELAYESEMPAHNARPDDDPEPGNRCKDCGRDIVWIGPGPNDWQHEEEA